MSDEIIREIRCEILLRTDPENVEKIKAYFREPVETYGISSPGEKEVVKKFYPAVKGDMNLSLQVAEALVKSGVLDEAGIGFRLVRRMVHNVEPTHFDVFDSWVDHINNWANTDGLSTWLISETVKKDPSLIERLLVWTSSENRWRRRAAAVSIVPIARKGGMLAEVFAIADRLMEDEDDMVRKGGRLAFQGGLKGAPRRGAGVPASLEGADFGPRAQIRLGETAKGEEGLQDQIKRLNKYFWSDFYEKI